jgi:hypothetical protein
MKTGYDNIYYLCKECNKVYNSFSQIMVEITTKEQRDLLIKGHCEKCYKEKLKKLEKL